MAEELFLDVYVTPDIQLDIESGSSGGGSGKDGITPHIGENKNWWIGDIDTNIRAEGINGLDGKDGVDGSPGTTIHNKLSDLGFKESGHTGFASASDLSSERIERITADTTLQANIDTVDAIARGKSRSIVFQTLSELDSWLAISYNVATLQIGDNFYIVERDVPDFWWDGTQKQVLEGEKVDLVDFYTKSQIDNKFASATSNLDNHISDNIKHITATERSTWDTKQAALVSGINIKTINGISPLGSGNIEITGGGGGGVTKWGDINGNIWDQADLVELLVAMLEWVMPIPVVITAPFIYLQPFMEVTRPTASTPTIMIDATYFEDGAEAKVTQTGAFTPVITVTGLTLYYVGAWTSVTPAAGRDMIYIFKRMGTKLYVTRNISSTSPL